MRWGSIPESFLSPTLKVLTLLENNIIGPLSSIIGDLVQMDILDLENNNLIGTICSKIGALYKLEGLYLDINSFNGTVPEQKGFLTWLENLYVCQTTSSLVQCQPSLLLCLLQG
jgi:hypothetical protein